MRKIASIISVNRILFRNSGTRKMFRNVLNMRLTERRRPAIVAAGLRSQLEFVVAAGRSSDHAA
jgi:hypothetical protein